MRMCSPHNNLRKRSLSAAGPSQEGEKRLQRLWIIIQGRASIGEMGKDQLDHERLETEVACRILSFAEFRPRILLTAPFGQNVEGLPLCASG